MSKITRKMRIRRMPKVSEVNMGTDCVDSVRPNLIEDGVEPTQCINGHWTIESDLDKNGHCSQCPQDDLFDMFEDDE